MQRRTTVIAAALVAACGVASACGRESGGGDSSSAPKTLRVALIGPQSGQLASLGDWDYKGVTLAANEINAKGGAGKLKIQITRMDDQGDPTTGGNLARKAVGEHFNVVFGSSSSTITLAMLPIVTAAKTPQITSGQADALTQQGSAFIFLDSPTSTTYDATLAEYVVGKLHKKKIAMITNNGAYGAGEHDAFLAAAEARRKARRRQGDPTRSEGDERLAEPDPDRQARLAVHRRRGSAERPDRQAGAQPRDRRDDC